ncbi:MAG: hypothetical protein AMXMBFR46_10970 [Acidimicrobiia bacterium]
MRSEIRRGFVAGARARTVADADAPARSSASARSCAPARRAVLTLLGALAVLAAGALPAGAHGAQGTLGVEVTPGAAPLTARVRVLLEYANDRDVVPGAAVSATATGPAGQVVGPQALADQGRGVYEATLTVPAPGSWTVDISAADPAATARATVVVSAAATPTTAITSPLGSTPTTAPGDVRASSDEVTRDQAGSGDDGGVPTALLVTGAAVVAVGAIVGGVVWSRRRARG